MVFSMICWGSWANTYKLTGAWRFELFYFDYAFGVLLAATIYAFTLGMFGDSLNFLDNLSITGKRQIAFGLSGGVIFNLANMLLVAAISVAGLSVAFPVGIGIALVIGVIWNYILAPQGNPLLLFGGSAVVIVAIIVDSLAYGTYDKQRPKVAAPKDSRSLQAPAQGGAKGLVLSVLSGILMGSFYPLVQMGMESEIGLKPYGMAFIFSIGVFLSTFVFNVYFMNLPVQGRPVGITTYFLGTKRQHLLGVLGGMIWITGTICNFAAASAPEEVNVGPAVSYALGQGATMVSVLWGLFVWKEFSDAGPKVRSLLTAMFVLFGVGLAMVSIAPLFSK